MTTAQALAALARDGWCILEDFLAPPEVEALHDEWCRLHAQGQARPGGVGRSGQTDSRVRGDEIAWFDPGALSPAQKAYWDAKERLRSEVNRACWLALTDLESHYAWYPPFAGYRRHQDRPRGRETRVISSVLYLNPDWRADDDGRLRLYLDSAPLDILPQWNRLVLFDSRIEHEVLPASRSRLSVAGWWKRRDAGGHTGTGN